MIGFFVDGSYLRKAWRATTSAPLSYARLRNHMEESLRDHISIAYWFDAQHPDVKDDRYKAALLGAGFRVQAHYRVAKETLHDTTGATVLDPRTNRPMETYRQKGVDIGLALAIERTYRLGNWNHLLLAAGDADFAELVADLVEREGVRVTLIGRTDSMSLALRPYAERIIDVSTLSDAFRYLRSA